MTTTECPNCGAALAPGAALCAGCVNALKVDLGSVPSRLDDLDLTLSRQDSRTSEGIGDPESPPVDYDVDASDARAELVRVVTTYGRRWLHDVAPIDPERLPAVERLYETTKGKAALIHSHRALTGALWAPLLAVELRDALKAAQHAIDRPPAAQFAGWCPAAEHAGTVVPMYVGEDAAYATCRACGLKVDAVDNRAATMAMASAKVERATPAQIAQAFGLKSSTIRSWVRRGWMSDPVDGKYLVAEVRALSMGMRPVKQAVSAADPG